MISTLNKCEIEEVLSGESPAMQKIPDQILKEDGLALVAAGSLACVRILYFRAYRLGKLQKFFGCPVNAREYGLGKQGGKLRKCIGKALEMEGIRGVIVYASCMEVLTLWDFEKELELVDNPLNIPVKILYRGPLVKRRKPVAESLRRILSEIRVEGGQAAQEERKSEMSGRQAAQEERKPGLSGREAALYFPTPPAPDFSGIASLLQEWTCETLLLTPGGCKSCIESADGIGSIKDLKSTRFHDVQVCMGCEEAITKAAVHQFTGSDLLCLIGSAVIKTVGMDVRGIAGEVEQSGRPCVYLESDGFEGAPPAMAKAWLTLGKKLLSNYPDNDSNKEKNSCEIWILGYSKLGSGKKEHLDPITERLRNIGCSVNIWSNKETESNGRLPLLTWVVSTEGLKLAQWLEETFHIPYVAEIPVGEIMLESFIHRIRWIKDKIPDQEQKVMQPEITDSRKVVIIGEPVLSFGIKTYLQKEKGFQNVHISVYAPTQGMQSFYRQYAKEVLVCTAQEELCGQNADIVIADPLFLPLFKEDIIQIPMPYLVFSGQIFADDSYEYAGKPGAAYLNRYLE